MTTINNAVKARFWKKVNIVNEAPATCWEWTGSRTGKYGKITVNGKRWRTHRLAYVLRYGYIPKDKPVVRHLCNNPLCVRDTHIVAGTQWENMQDRKRAGNYAHTPAAKAKIRAAREGKKHKPSTIKKMAERRAAWWTQKKFADAIAQP